MAFIIKRWHKIGDGWTLYRYRDTGDEYMVSGEVIATSNEKGDSDKVATNKRMLARDIISGVAEIRGFEIK